MKKKLEIPSSPLKVKNHQINRSDSVKYLVLLLDKRLTFNKHVEFIINKVSNAVKCMYPLINRKSSLKTKNKILLYKVGIRPILTYGAPVFSTAAKTHLKKIQTTQNKILKMILNVPWYENYTHPSTIKSSLHPWIPDKINNQISSQIDLEVFKF